MKRTLAALASLAALAAGPLATTSPAAAAPAPDAGAAEAGFTRVVLRVDGCDECRFQPSSYVQDGIDVRSWTGREVGVSDGRVVLRVPTDYTRGMSIAVRAPWERRTNAVSQVVFRYAGMRPGDRVTVRDARSARKGNACYGGTGEGRLVVPVKVVRAHFEGAGRAVGAATFATVAQRTVYPNYPTFDGYSGAQEVPCFPS